MDRWLNLPVFPVFPFNLFTGISVTIVGLNMGIKSNRQIFYTGRYLPRSKAVHDMETGILVTNGIYAYSRNPMMLGYSLFSIGVGLMFQSLGMVIFLTPLVMLVNFFMVKTREEPRLLERFGEEYNLYRQSTPFLFPNWVNLIEEYLIPYISKHRDQFTYVILAELSLLVTTLLVFNDYTSYTFLSQRLFSSILFAAICVLGIIAGIAPRWCSFGVRSERRGTEGVGGHHPDCGSFSGHIVKFMGKVYCAGCSGLVLGALTGLLGLILSLFGWFSFDPVVVFWIGALFVGLGLSQHFIDLGSGWVHLWLNFWFVLGAWFMFEVVQLLNTGFLASVYFLIVTVFWIFARIRASQYAHVNVCSTCIDVCLLVFE
jgi:protein-S-isoprenylcysteine O-methyltransferase Ste14